MDWLAGVLLSLQGLFILVCIIILVYLIFKRLEEKKSENFEDRDN